MEIEQIDEVLEALLFVSGNGLSISEITELLALQKSEVNGAVNRLKSKYSGKSGIHLISYNGKIQLCTNPRYADAVAQVLNPIKEKELSNATLETVAIVAYKQPVTRLEIEEIRGVSCEYAVQVLLKHGLIEAVGRRDAVGKPLLFGTTEAFLKRFQIESIDQLPDYDKLIESFKIVESLKDREPPKEQSMYNEFDIPEEEKAEGKENSDADSAQSDLPEVEELPDFLAGEDNLQKIS